MPLSSVAIYRRTVAASLERVRENVLDWEHLPWLHRETFAHVRLLERRRDGFRAETSLRGAAAGEHLEIDVAFEASGLCYHSRTVAGAGTGTDIVTRLAPTPSGSTNIEVRFLAPGVAGERAHALGGLYVDLYTRLWDQDEAMMIRRQASLDGELDPSMREVCVDGARIRHATVCPHLGGPLGDAAVDADGCITCPWHGYRFDLRTGSSADGRALRLPTERV